MMNSLFLIRKIYQFPVISPALNKLCAKPGTYRTSLIYFTWLCFGFTMIVPLPLNSTRLSSPKSTSDFVDPSILTNIYLFPIIWLLQPLSKSHILGNFVSLIRSQKQSSRISVFIRKISLFLFSFPTITFIMDKYFRVKTFYIGFKKKNPPSLLSFYLSFLFALKTLMHPLPHLFGRPIYWIFATLGIHYP